MPSDDGSALDEKQELLPLWPEAPQVISKQLIGGAEFGFLGLPVERGELMSQRQILQREQDWVWKTENRDRLSAMATWSMVRPTSPAPAPESTLSKDCGVFAAPQAEKGPPARKKWQTNWQTAANGTKPSL